MRVAVAVSADEIHHGLAAMLVGAVALVPFAILDAGGALASPVALGACAAIGLLGSALPYALGRADGSGPAPDGPGHRDGEAETPL